MTEDDYEWWAYDGYNPPRWPGTKMIGPFRSATLAEIGAQMMGVPEEDVKRGQLFEVRKAVSHQGLGMDQLIWPKGRERR